jgi:hypothetical protein
MSASQTSALPPQPTERIYVADSGVASLESSVLYAGSAQSTRGGLSRFGAFAAPLAVAAMFFGGAPLIDRRIYAGSTSTTSDAQQMAWLIGTDWSFSEAYVTDAEIEALNQLYRLSAPEGMFLSLPDA